MSDDNYRFGIGCFGIEWRNAVFMRPTTRVVTIDKKISILVGHPDLWEESMRRGC